MLPTPIKSIFSSAALQACRNVLARAELFKEFGAFTSAEVADLDRWKQEGLVFSVTYRGATYFPAFQFDAQGRPLPVIADVIRHLGGEEKGEWQLALWFTASTGWLDGQRPVDLLECGPEEVAEAAERKAEPLFY
jgi:hypothetical protein